MFNCEEITSSADYFHFMCLVFFLSYSFYLLTQFSQLTWWILHILLHTYMFHLVYRHIVCGTRVPATYANYTNSIMTLIAGKYLLILNTFSTLSRLFVCLTSWMSCTTFRCAEPDLLAEYILGEMQRWRLIYTILPAHFKEVVCFIITVAFTKLHLNVASVKQ